MVLFRDDDEKYNGFNIHAILEKCISNCTDLDRQMVAMDREEVHVDPFFLEESSWSVDQCIWLSGVVKCNQF